MRLFQKRLAAIQYTGTPGITAHCIDAIARLIHFGDKIEIAKLLSCEDRFGASHGFLLSVNYGDQIAVKSGFTSGYSGEGPRGLSTVLQLLERHGVEIEEYIVGKKIIGRINSSSLLQNDIEDLGAIHPIRPVRWHDYIYEQRGLISPDNEALRRVLPVALPFSIVDLRIMDLALKLEMDPDGAINSCYRRLEDIVRERSGLKSESGSKLFSKAFVGEKSIFYWGDIDGGEHHGKANMFTSVFGAYRNRRAHKEFNADATENLREFLLINELFVLESQSVHRLDE